MWFRYRLAFMALFFGAAVAVGLAVARLEDPPTLLAPLGVLVGKDAAFAVSGVLCVLAFVVRVWGESLLGALVYGQRTDVPTLVTGGPFALSRNPLYLGTFCFFVGSTAPYLPPLLLALLAVKFAVLLRQIVLDEEAPLRDRADWTAYAARVPRFVGVARGGDGAGAARAVSPTGAVVAAAVASNLFLFTLGLYRLVAAARGAPSKLLGLLNVVGLVVWLGTVLVRRMRQSPLSG